MNDLITELIDGTIELVLHHHDVTSPLPTNTEFRIPDKFVLIYDESSSYEFTRESKRK